MSIDERIQSAWEQQCGDDELSPNLSPEKREGFELGYRAALRSLFVEVKQKDTWPKFKAWGYLPESQTWVSLCSDEVIRWRCNIGDRSLQRFRRIVGLEIPHPSEIFGEGV